MIFPKPKSYKQEKQKEDKRKEKKQAAFTLLGKAAAGLAVTQKTLSAKHPRGSELLLQRNDSETTLETFQLSGQVELRHKSGWAFASGYQRTQIAERFDFVGTLVETELIEGLKSVRINLYGDSIRIMGELPLTRNTEINQKYYNTYTLIDIPFLLAYYHQSEKWNIGVQAGVLSNISLKTEGKIRSVDTWNIDLAEKQDQLFKSRVAWSYSLSLVVERSLTNHLFLSFSPNLHYYPNDFAVASYDLSQNICFWEEKLDWE